MTVLHTFSESCLLNITLHAAKYPDRPVFGALVGKRLPIVSVVESVPLLHSLAIPSAITKTALYQLELYCKLHKEDVEILGFYWSPAVCNDADFTIPSPIQLLAAGDLDKQEEQQQTHSLPVLLRLGLSKPTVSHTWTIFDGCYGMTVYSSADGSWKMLSTDEWNLVDLTSSTLADADGDEKNSVQSLFRRCIQDEKYLELADFEDHLVDRALDWLPRGQVSLSMN